MIKAEDMKKYFRIHPDSRSLNYEKYFSDGELESNINKEYNSSNTEILNKEQLKKILLELPEVKSQL